MKYKGLNITVPEWVKFNDTQIIPYKTLIKNAIKVQLKNKVYYLNSKSICEKTPFKDFQGNNIYLCPSCCFLSKHEHNICRFPLW